MSRKPTEIITEALRLMDEEGLNAYTAAKTLGLAESSVYSAFQRRKLRWLVAKEEGKCIHCGAPVDANGHYVEPHGGPRAKADPPQGTSSVNPTIS